MRNRQTGQSILEVIVAATVGILVVAALTFVTIFSLRNANFAKTSAQATKLAQEGIERVRTGRARGQCINLLSAENPYYSWNGGNSSCGNPVIPIWNLQITDTGGCDDPLSDDKCYFRVNPDGVLNNIGYNQILFPTSGAEPIPPPPAKPVFYRAVILSDDPSSFTAQKTVTVIVTWNDATGPHESKLVTILSKL